MLLPDLRSSFEKKKNRRNRKWQRQSGAKQTTKAKIKENLESLVPLPLRSWYPKRTSFLVAGLLLFLLFKRNVETSTFLSLSGHAGNFICTGVLPIWAWKHTAFFLVFDFLHVILMVLPWIFYCVRAQPPKGGKRKKKKKRGKKIKREENSNKEERRNRGARKQEILCSKKNNREKRPEYDWKISFKIIKKKYFSQK